MATDPALELCPQCQHPVTPGTTTCPNCGHVLSEETDSTAPEQALATDEPSSASIAEETLPSVEDSDTAESGAIIVPIPDNLPASEATTPKKTGVLSESTPETTESQPPLDNAALLIGQSASLSATNNMPPAQPRRRIIKVVLIAAAVLLVLAATGGGILYVLTRPQPVINVTSDYYVGTVPAGSISTILHIEGSQFSSYSGIIFLLDGKPAPDSQVVPSDQNGNIEADLVVSPRWAIGAHQLTARDINGYTTHTGIKVMMVQQGQANTPGPNGAPADDAARFTLWMNGASQSAFVSVLNGGGRPPATLTVQGQPDPAGGSVCDLAIDTGKPTTITYPSPTGLLLGGGSGFTFIGPLNSLQKQTTAYTCSGAYQNGKISYTETNTIDTEVYSDGHTCKLAAPRVTYQMQGAFNSAATAIGTYSIPASELKCSDGSVEKTSAETGIWTAIMTM